MVDMSVEAKGEVDHGLLPTGRGLEPLVPPVTGSQRSGEWSAFSFGTGAASSPQRRLGRHGRDRTRPDATGRGRRNVASVNAFN